MAIGIYVTASGMVGIRRDDGGIVEITAKEYRTAGYRPDITQLPSELEYRGEGSEQSTRASNDDDNPKPPGFG